MLDAESHDRTGRARQFQNGVNLEQAEAGRKRENAGTLPALRVIRIIRSAATMPEASSRLEERRISLDRDQLQSFEKLEPFQDRLEHPAFRWNHLKEEKMLDIQKLEHRLRAKPLTLLRAML